jgi:hypothetical protein
MKELFQGTNPTVSFTTGLKPQEVEIIYLVFIQKGKVLFRKEADSVTWGENFLAVTLTQEESYKLNEGLTSVRVRFKAQNGLVSFTDPYYFTVIKDEGGEVIL